jgi:hypothetical protein
MIAMRRGEEIATVLLILVSEAESIELELELDVMTPLDSYRRLIEKVTNRDTYGRMVIFKH